MASVLDALVITHLSCRLVNIQNIDIKINVTLFFFAPYVKDVWWAQ